MRIIWSSKAETDLYNIIGYIHEYSPLNAKKVLKSILEFSETFANRPYKYQKEEFFNDESVRRAVTYSYRIVYKIYKEDIKILRVFNTRQQPNKI
ncbi:MAG: hypothetical protein CSA38_04005 [Flavobacteriales bacterium]|nr:MAG: hypothetical protein CSA38_04005 [Flavobacteriales bacterium]